MRAPRYESYNGRLLELFREVYRKNPELSPDVLLTGFYGIWGPGDFSLKTYVLIVVRRGKEATSLAELQKAADGLTAVEDFGERVAAQTQAGWYSQWYLGTRCQIQALKGQKELFEYRGLTQEVARASARLSAREAERERSEASFRLLGKREAQRVCFVDTLAMRKACTVHGLMLLVIVLSSCLAVSLFLFELKPARKLKITPRLQRIAALAVDYFPVVLVLNGIAFLTLFQPYARTFNALLSEDLTQWRSDELRDSYQYLLSAPDWALSNVSEALFSPYHLWIIFTAVLSAIALFITMRGFLRVARGYSK